MHMYCKFESHINTPKDKVVTAALGYRALGAIFYKLVEKVIFNITCYI